jgi:hypothetical protein
MRSRLITGLRVRAVLPVAVALASLASPAAAGAHLRSGTVAVDYRASVVGAQMPAYSAQIFQSDRAVGVTVKPRHVVIVLGYLGEPVFRLDGAGLWVNTASPTAVAFRLVKKSQRGSTSTPRWRLQRGRPSVIWQDARAQGLQPGVRRGAWSIPVIVDGRRTRLGGELWHFPAPSPWPWLGVLVGLLAAGLSLRVLRLRDPPSSVERARPAGSVAIAFALAAAAASTVILLAFALDPYASPGTWIEGVDAIAFLGVGVWALLRGPEHLRVAAAIGVGLVGLAVALLEIAIFLHPIVLAVLPATAIRIIDVVAMGAGLNAAALGCFLYVETGGLMQSDKPEVGPTIPNPHAQR